MIAYKLSYITKACGISDSDFKNELSTVILNLEQFSSLTELRNFTEHIYGRVPKKHKYAILTMISEENYFINNIQHEILTSKLLGE